MSTSERPVYRHIIVKCNGFINLTADVSQLKEAQRQLQEVESGDREKVGPDSARLVKRGHLRQTLKRVYGDAGTDKFEDLARGQRDVLVVARLNEEHVPGGGQLPNTATFWTYPANYSDMDPQAAFMEAALALQERFRQHSDTKFMLVPEDARAGVTLVTVAYSPIVAYPLDPRLGERGFEVGIEFHQVTRFGSVNTDSFEVYSEEGVYPIHPPSEGSLLTLMKTVEEWGATDKGFFTEDRSDPKRKNVMRVK